MPTVDLVLATEEDLLTPPPWLLSSVKPSLTWSIHVGDSLNGPIVIAISIASIQRLDHRPFGQVRWPGMEPRREALAAVGTTHGAPFFNSYPQPFPLQQGCQNSRGHAWFVVDRGPIAPSISHESDHARNPIALKLRS